MKKKVLLTLICALALVIGSVFGTMAYLTDTESVQNTFTVGKVNITLDETDTDDSTANADRDKANVYHLIPGETVDKDPVVHVLGGSEECWAFVKIENGLADIVDCDKLKAQILANGWAVLDETNNPGVYYQKVAKSDENTDLKVFQSFTVKGAEVGNSELGGIVPNGGKDLNNYKTAKITVTAYAIQAAGFTTADKAWENFD